MSRIFLSLGLLIALSVPTAPVQAKVFTNACAQLISAIEHRQLVHGADSSLPVTWTAKAINSIPGKRGGRILEVQRTGSEWDYKEPTPPQWLQAMNHLIPLYDLNFFYFEKVYLERLGKDPQGNPLLFMKVFGPALGEFFGFKRLSNSTILMPDVQEFNLSIKALNLLLERVGTDFRMMIKGYAVNQRFVDVETYLRRWAEEGILPVGIHTSFYHDLNFHLIFTQLIPPEYLSLSRRQTAVLLKFQDFLKGKNPTFFSKFKIQRFLKACKQLQSNNLDVGTGSYEIKFSNALEESGEKEGAGWWETSLSKMVGPRVDHIDANTPLTPLENLESLIALANAMGKPLDSNTMDELLRHLADFKSQLDPSENALAARDIGPWVQEWSETRLDFLRKLRFDSPSQGPVDPHR